MTSKQTWLIKWQQKIDIWAWRSQFYLIHLDNFAKFVQNTDFFIIYKPTHILLFQVPFTSQLLTYTFTLYLFLLLYFVKFTALSNKIVLFLDETELKKKIKPNWSNRTVAVRAEQLTVPGCWRKFIKHMTFVWKRKAWNQSDKQVALW